MNKSWQQTIMLPKATRLGASLRSGPLGCDTFVAYPPATAAGTVVFGKNSDRPSGEGQAIRRYPAARHVRDSFLKCTYINIPQVERTHAILLSQIDWMWGAEMGANEFGVVIGNEAVWTKVDEEEDEEEALLGMDLVRLGLERASTSRQALDVITSLLETHGQGGACAQNDPGFTYHNSYLIADSKEGWILETAGRHWAAERILLGSRNISNGLTIRTGIDLCSASLKQHAKERGWWDGKQVFDFAASYSAEPVTAADLEGTRQSCGTALLEKQEAGAFDANAMMAILRDHEGGICMHGGFETTASMVSEIRRVRQRLRKQDEGERQETGGGVGDGAKEHITAKHWMTGKPHPCWSEFIEQDMPS